MDVAGNCVVAKTVSQKGKESRCVEENNDTSMGPTCTQGLVAGTGGWQATDFVPGALRAV